MILVTRGWQAAAVILAAALLASCSSGGSPDSDPGDGSADEVPCVVGTWQLDVPDYATQSEAFVVDLGLPITDFAMTGAGTIQFTADGLVATDITLTTTGTIVAGEVTVPLDTQSAYTGSGDWSLSGGGNTLNLANWANVPDPDVPIDPEAPPLPAIDYTDIPAVTVECSADTLVLQGPDAPLAARWHR